jgi:hypothetical protein
MPNKIPGEYAWGIMSLGILLYDLTAIKTKKAETMSSALWRSLQHPVKLPTTTIVWLIITHHLFVSANARSSIRNLLQK